MESSHACPPPEEGNGGLLQAEPALRGLSPARLLSSDAWATGTSEVRGQLGRVEEKLPFILSAPGLHIAQNNTLMPLEGGPCGLPGGWGGNESRRFSEMQWFREEGRGAQRRPDRLLPDWCSESFGKGSSPVDRSRFLS